MGGREGSTMLCAQRLGLPSSLWHTRFSFLGAGWAIYHCRVLPLSTQLDGNLGRLTDILELY